MSSIQGAPSNHPFALNTFGNGRGDNNYTPITNQPNAKEKDARFGGDDGSWMPIPVVVPVCSPGLEYLTMVDQLLVHQKVELLEALLGCETQNKYTIKNSVGQTIFKAIEDTDCCTRNCFGPLRPFDLKILDSRENEVIHLYRELRCQLCCCPCCLQRMEVQAPPGNVVGVVEQEWSILRPSLKLMTPNEETVFRIDGPLCTLSCCNDVDFPIYAINGNTIGKVTKQWSGLAREAFTDADHFGITFPLDLDVNMKALLVGALFLIDFMYYETKK